jgi:hypothetical protein
MSNEVHLNLDFRAHAEYLLGHFSMTEARGLCERARDRCEKGTHSHTFNCEVLRELDAIAALQRST